MSLHFYWLEKNQNEGQIKNKNELSSSNKEKGIIKRVTPRFTKRYIIIVESSYVHFTKDYFEKLYFNCGACIILFVDVC